MMRRRRRLGMTVSATLLLLLAACSTNDTPPPTAGATADVNRGGRYKIGKPYQIKGVWYYPQLDYEYAEVGVASWYGPGFHGQMTANGEVYDMNDMTAAHRTLPMPSVVRVTNLENGRTVRLRVNDRGPYAANRIIDLSRRAAQLLGVYAQGTAMVKVEIDAEDSRQIAEAMTGTAYPTLAQTMPPKSLPVIGASKTNVDAIAGSPGGDVVLASADSPPALAAIGETLPPPAAAPAEPPPAAAAPDTVDAQPLPPPAPARSAAVTPPGRNASMTSPKESAAVAAPVRWVPQEDRPSPAARGAAIARFVQAGAFADPGNAQAARSKLTDLGPVEVRPVAVDGRTMMRVRVGPLPSQEAAQRVLAQVVEAGFAGSRLVVE